MEKETLLTPQSIQRHRKPSSLPDHAYQAIRETLASGRIPPGAPLRQRDLARELGISLSTVREALNRLAAEGLIVYEPYRGFRTVFIRPGDLQDFYELAIEVEGLAMEVAAPLLTDEDLSRMRELLPRTDFRREQARAALAANMEFNQTAWRRVGRPLLDRFLSQLIDLGYSHAALSRMTPEQLRRRGEMMLRWNTRILQALEARDGKAAREALSACYREYLPFIQHVMSTQ